jgi:hypothetical protein
LTCRDILQIRCWTTPIDDHARPHLHIPVPNAIDRPRRRCHDLYGMGIQGLWCHHTEIRQTKAKVKFCGRTP